MELHTLGVTAATPRIDVVNVARCFTGWTMRNRTRRPDSSATTRRTITDRSACSAYDQAGGGMHDGEQVLDLLARNPATARFIATKSPARALSLRLRRSAAGAGGSRRESVSKRTAICAR